MLVKHPLMKSEQVSHPYRTLVQLAFACPCVHTGFRETWF